MNRYIKMGTVTEQLDKFYDLLHCFSINTHTQRISFFYSSGKYFRTVENDLILFN